MNKTITNRDDIFLAKSAGRNVDISTMTPPVAASTKEELLLEIADRVDELENGSGGGGSALPTPGTAGNVLTSTGSGWDSAAPSKEEYWIDITYGDPFTTQATCAEVLAQVTSGKTVLAKIDLGSQKLTLVCTTARSDKCVFVGGIDEGVGAVATLITDQGGNTVVTPSFYAYVPRPNQEGADNGKIPIVDDDEYELVSPSTLSNDYKVTLTVDQSTGTITADKTIAEIVAAFEADKNVYARLNVEIDGVTTKQRFELSQVIGNYVEFYHVEIDDNQGAQTTKSVSVYGRNSGSGDIWDVV